MDLFRIVESYYEISIVANTSTSNNPDGNLKIKKRYTYSEAFFDCKKNTDFGYFCSY